MFDFESGTDAKPPVADVWWEQVDATRRYLVPQNGAQLARLGSVEFDPISRASLLSQRYAPLKIDGSTGPSNALTAGTVVAVMTRNRHWARMRVDTYGYDLAFSWVTYE